MNRTAAFITYIFIFCASSLSAITDIDTLNFKVQSEGFHLHAQLIKKSTKENLPVIIFLTTTGRSSSLNANYKDFTEFFLEKTFLENDFAIVYFDNRGEGQSEGAWYETTFKQRAADVVNVAKAVQGFDFINKNKIILVGHDQGGWIAQMAVSDYPEIFTAGVSMATPTFGVKKQLINEYISDFICRKGNDEAKALQKATKKAEKQISRAVKSGKKGKKKQLQLTHDFEPKRYLLNMERPFLLILAENDEQVDPKWCLEELPIIFPSGKPSHIKIYTASSETHFFKKAPKCYDRDWKNYPDSEDTQRVLYGWIIEKVKK